MSEPKHISEYIDRIERIKDSLVSDMDEFRDRMDEFYGLVQNIPHDELNQLITAGFVPRARFVFDGKQNLKFVGYTEFLRLDFLDENDNRHIYADLEATAKRVDMFKKVEDDK